MSIASPEDLKLIEKLIQRGLVERAPLIEMLEAQKQAFEASHRTLSGTLYQLEPAAGLLRVTDLASRQDLLVYPLSRSLPPQDWQLWAQHRLLLKESEGTQLLSQELAPGEIAGLVLSREGAWSYTPEGLKAQWLGYGLISLFPGQLKNRGLSGPWDLFLSPDLSLLALSDRGAGTVEVFSTENHQKRAHFQIRPPGGQTCLNLTFHLREQQILVTDSSSSQLYCGNLLNGELEAINPGVGMLGNLAMAPDQEHLYLLTLKPAQELLYLKAGTWSVSKHLPLKGKLYHSQGYHPCDLLALSPDQSQLLVVTHQNTPDPLTPVISVLDTAQVKTLRRYALKDGTRPYQLLWARANPLQEFQQKSLRQMLLESGLVDAQTLERLDAPEPEIVVTGDSHPSTWQAPQEFIPPPLIIPQVTLRKPLPGPASPPAVPSPPEPPPPPLASASQSQPVPVLELAVELEPLILDWLNERFRLEFGVDLSAFPRPWEILQAESKRLRQALETQREVEIQLDKLYEGRSLKTVLRRRQLLARQEREAWLAQQPPQIVPHHCPQCHQDLMNHWECQVCGFELESPLRAYLHGVASAEPTVELAVGHFLLPDPQGLRLLELNARKEVVWSLEPDQLSCEYPCDLIRLPGERLLVADSRRHQIYEMGLRGKIYWSMKTFESEQHRLKHPVRVGWRQVRGEEEPRIQIVDQGHHRVLEIDRKSQILWQFGVRGEAGCDFLHLDTPSDLQWTPDQTWLITDTGNRRVLELDAEGHLEQVFDHDSYGLLRPVCAQRLWNGHTLIVDAEAFQILELDALGVVRERLSYYKTGMPMDLRLLDPSRLIRLPNQDLILFNERKALHILPAQKKLLWFSPLDQLLSQPVRSVSEPASPPQPAPVVSTAAAPPVPATPSRPTPPEVPARFRRVSAQERLQALINRPAVQKSHTESYEHSVVFSREEVELTALSPYLIDQRHNAIVRIDRKGRVIWHYGYDLEQRLSRPQFIQVTSHALIIADTGNNRVLEVSRLDKELLNEIKGPRGDRLNHPRSACMLANGHYLIADQYNQRLLELTPAGEKVWEFKREALIASPQYAEELPGGDILFTDALLNRVTRVTRSGQVLWYYGSSPKIEVPGKRERLFGPSFATALENGHLLIADTRHHRVPEIDASGQLLWEYTGHARSNRLNPTFLTRLENGNTLVTFFNHTKLVELTPKKACVWSFSLGKDVFQAPVEGSEDALVQHEAEAIRTYYNAIEQRMILSAREAGQDVVEIHIELMDGVQMKSVRATLLMMQAEAFGQVLKSFPPPEDLMADRFGRHLVLTCALYPRTDRDQLLERLSGVAEVLAVTAQDPDLIARSEQQP